jgi:putative copper resistance protein D
LIGAGLVAARFAHFAAVTVLFGLALFPLYSRPSRTSVQPAGVGRWLRASVQCATVLGLLSALAWAWFAIAGMTGTMMAAADVDSLFTVLRETSFGQIWVGRLVLGVVLLTVIMRRSNEHHPDWTMVLLAGLLLVSLALVGHTQTSDGVLWIVHMSADGAHLLAAGAWLGGLLALGHVLLLVRQFPSADHNAQALAALVRFSVMGYAAVAILIGSGLVNAWLQVGSLGRLATTPYGQLLLVKLCLLAGMLALAAHNRFRLVPALQRSTEGYLSADSSLRMLRRNVIGEQILGLAIVLIVGCLGTLPPAITASQ